MRHHPFGATDKQISRLGFGCMRFPLIDPKDPASINTAESIHMIHAAMDQGMNYFDTAYPYHNGQSEVVLGKALQNGLRNKVIITTKMPIWDVETLADCDRFLDEQLKRLQTDHIDFYLIHAVWSERWEKVKNLEIIPWMEKAKQAGKIGHIGFSFHDTAERLKEIIDYYDGWELCQIQYNFLNRETQAGDDGLAYLNKKNIPTIIMEPLMGGTIPNPPEPIQQIWNDAKMNPADVSLRWIWNQPGVSVIISGMSTFEQVQANINSIHQFESNGFTPEEETTVQKVTDAYNQSQMIPCTRCSYCMPCPTGVDIPRNFQMYNESYINPSLNKSMYAWHFPDSEKATQCIECGICENKCPQHIPISKWMTQINERFNMIEV